MIREATQADTFALAELAVKMWSNHTASELQIRSRNPDCSSDIV